MERARERPLTNTWWMEKRGRRLPESKTVGDGITILIFRSAAGEVANTVGA
jgi:hypothetical protein